MTSKNEAVRIRHYQGERLKARDLQDEHDNLAWMRGLHVVALHDTWGISLGFDAQLVRNDGRRSVLVSPGFAYDYRGREILLAKSQRLFVPDVKGSIELVIRYDEAIGGDHDAFAPCHTGSERPAFVWRRAGETRLGLEIPLILITADGLVDFSTRRYAQPMVRPHMGSGITPPEQYWQAMSGPSVLNMPVVGFQTWVDTSSAGFVQTPSYQAQLTYPQAALGASGIFGQLAERSAMLLGSAVDPTPSGFVFRFTVVCAPFDNPVEPLSWDNFPMPQVSWSGIEPVVGCAPPLNWQAIALQFHLPMLSFL